jgi:5'-nucleotidase
MRNLLLSNDDGIGARGLWELKGFFEEAIKGCRVFVVAPDRERSATGHSISLHDPIRLKVIEKERVFAVNGTPVDAVHMAILSVIPKPIDLVITGINNGLNLGTDVCYSGTVSAAFHAVAHGVPAVAVSIDNSGSSIHYETAAYYAGKVAEKLEHEPLSAGTILNINVPNLPVSEIRGVEITRLGRRRYNESIIEREDPQKNKYYLIKGVLSRDIPGDETDVKAVSGKKVSITPLVWDVTAHDAVDELRNMGFHKL